MTLLSSKYPSFVGADSDKRAIGPREDESASVVGDGHGIGVYGLMMMPAEQRCIIHHCGPIPLPFLSMVDFADLTSSVAVGVATGSVACQDCFGLRGREGPLRP